MVDISELLDPMTQRVLMRYGSFLQPKIETGIALIFAGFTTRCARRVLARYLKRS